MTLRIGWFTTARGAGSRGMYEAVRDAVRDGSLDAEMAVVFCNRDEGEDPTTDAFLDLVRADGTPVVAFSSVRYRRAAGGERSRPGEPLPAWRRAYDAEVARRLEPYPFDLGMLAGYMLIFSAGFVARHPLLNLHPALPDGPVGTWREVIRALVRGRASESGAMLHLAIPEVDAGPVVAFGRYPLRGPAFDAAWAELNGRIDALDDEALEATPLFATIRAAMVDFERPFLVAALAAFAGAGLHIEGERLLDASGAPAEPVEVTDAVAERLRPSPTR